MSDISDGPDLAAYVKLFDDTPRRIYPRPDDVKTTQLPIDQSYNEYTHAIGRHLEVFYFQQTPRPPLEDFAASAYDGWVTVWPNPLALSHVKEKAGSDKELGATMLRDGLIRDAAIAHTQYLKNIENGTELKGYTRPCDVRAGRVTWNEVVSNVVKHDDFSRWANEEYVSAVTTLKKMRAEYETAERMMWIGTDKIAETRFTLTEKRNAAHIAWQKALGEFKRVGIWA
ncbi:hypothetical protein V5O48_006859 [Marasmius crinis-equi]|uniref:Uncharacterized protein n=1 Tax=Marasmius crinis-equi TaxID=585013 RepID=A0ABR3FIS1_9AGAR